MSSKTNRRNYVKYSAVGIIGVAVGAAGGYYSRTPGPEKIVTQTATAYKTVTEQATATKPTPTPTPTGPLADYLSADIDWRQCEGKEINVLLSTHAFFNTLNARTEEFTNLTGVKVNFEHLPPVQLREKTLLDFEAGTGLYDVHAVDESSIPLYISNEWIADLYESLQDPKLTDEEWINTEDFQKPHWNMDHEQGKLGALPFSGMVGILFYRKDLFEQKGLVPPNTFDELLEAAEKLHDPPNVYGAVTRGMKGQGQNAWVMGGILQSYNAHNGADNWPSWFDKDWNIYINTEESTEALKMYTDICAYSPPGVETWNWPECVAAFQQGIVAMYYDNSEQAYLLENPQDSKVSGKVGYTLHPLGGIPERWAGIFNWAMSMNNSSKNKDATWLWLQWATSAPNMKKMLTEHPFTYASPTRLSVITSPEYKIDYNFGEGQFVETLDEMYKLPYLWKFRPRIPEGKEIQELYAIAIQDALVKGDHQKQLDICYDSVKDVMTKAGYYK